MADGDLTDLATVKALIGVTTNDADAVLTALITAVSSTICGFCDRSTFEVATYTDTIDGNGKNWLLLNEWPVQSITSIAYDTTVITQAASGLPLFGGYQLQPPRPSGGNQRLTLFGYCFPRGRGNVQITYDAGYETIPPSLQQIANELVNEAFARKGRPGQTSKSLGGNETVSFSSADMNATVKRALNSYIKTNPF